MKMFQKSNGLFISLDHNVDIKIEDVEHISNGINKKIFFQFQCFQDYGFNMDMLCPYKSRIHFLHAIMRRLPLSGYFPYGKNYIKRANDFCFIYLRAPWFMNSDTPNFIMRMKENNPRLKVIVEIPTYDSAESLVGEINHWHMWPLYWKNRSALKNIKLWCDRIVTYSRDECIYGIQTIRTSNAINPSAVYPISYTKADKSSINLVACSSMAFWHGYDRVIEGLKLYKKQKSNNTHVVFHIVGDGEELKHYKELVDKYDLSKEVIFYGYKSGKELDEIYNESDIAIDSLGRHRSNVYYNSSLKCKEYLAKGLPVISGVTNELDYDSNFKYYFRIPPDESPLDIDSVIKFYNCVYNAKDSRDDVINYISTYAREHFSYKETFKPIVDYIQKQSFDKKVEK